MSNLEARSGRNDRWRASERQYKSVVSQTWVSLGYHIHGIIGSKDMTISKFVWTGG